MNVRLALSSIGIVVVSWGAASAQETTERVSVDSSGGEGNGDSGIYAFGSPNFMGIALSADGNVVAFGSDASNLVSGDTNQRRDAFVHDRSTGVTELVSVDSSGAIGNGNSSFPALSADGMVVAFWSDASNLVATDTNGASDVFVHDRTTGVTERVSVDSTGAQGNGSSYDAAISADGQIVAFSSSASNLVAGDTNGTTDVFVHDRSTGITELISVSSSGLQVKKPCTLDAISADGRFVVFDSLASALVPGDTNLVNDVFVHDRTTGTTERVSVDSSGVQGDRDSYGGSISDDGQIVAFQSSANNFAPNFSRAENGAFVHDRSTGITELISVRTDGVRFNWDSALPVLSGDGQIAAFFSNASNAGPSTTFEVYVRDRARGRTDLVSLDSAGDVPNSSSWAEALSNDGQIVAFGSQASNLVAGDTNGFDDVFVHERCAVDAFWSSYGQGYPGTNGVPSFVARSNPVRGASLTLDVGSSSGTYAFGLLLVGYQRADLPSSWGGDLLVAPALSLALGLAPTGVSVTGTLPDDDRLCGVVVDLQVLQADPGATKGVSFTPGLELVVGQ